jgi:hypothetical protein
MLKTRITELFGIKYPIIADATAVMRRLGSIGM